MIPVRFFCYVENTVAGQRSLILIAADGAVPFVPPKGTQFEFERLDGKPNQTDYEPSSFISDGHVGWDGNTRGEGRLKVRLQFHGNENDRVIHFKSVEAVEEWVNEIRPYGFTLCDSCGDPLPSNVSYAQSQDL